MPPAFRGAESFEQFGLADQIGLLIMARYAGIANRRHVLGTEPHDLAQIVIADAAFAAAIGDQLAGFLPGAQSLDLDAERFRRFAYLHGGL